MFRTSSYLAIALSFTAIASATTPAAALSSQFIGGAGNHLTTQFHPAPTVTNVQPSQQVSAVQPIRSARCMPPAAPLARIHPANPSSMTDTTTAIPPFSASDSSACDSITRLIKWPTPCRLTLSGAIASAPASSRDLSRRPVSSAKPASES